MFTNCTSEGCGNLVIEEDRTDAQGRRIPPRCFDCRADYPDDKLPETVPRHEFQELVREHARVKGMHREDAEHLREITKDRDRWKAQLEDTQAFVVFRLALQTEKAPCFEMFKRDVELFQELYVEARKLLREFREWADSDLNEGCHFALKTTLIPVLERLKRIDALLSK